MTCVIISSYNSKRVTFLSFRAIRNMSLTKKSLLWDVKCIPYKSFNANNKLNPSSLCWIFLVAARLVRLSTLMLNCRNLETKMRSKSKKHQIRRSSRLRKKQNDDSEWITDTSEDESLYPGLPINMSDTDSSSSINCTWRSLLRIFFASIWWRGYDWEKRERESGERF